jgi:hypothetical protein
VADEEERAPVRRRPPEERTTSRERPAARERPASRERPPARERPAPREREDRTEREDRSEREDRPERDERPQREDRPKKLSSTRLAQLAVSHLKALTTRDIEAVVGMSRKDDGNLVVILEVVENHHFPDSADIMAEYSVEVDPDGELVGYSRGPRYLRGRPGDK